MAEHADACNLFGEPDAVARKVEVLRQHCAAVGRDPATISVTHLGTVLVGDDHGTRRPARRGHPAAARSGRATRPSRARRHRRPTRRTASRYVDAGVDHVVVSLVDVAEPGAIERYGAVIERAAAVVPSAAETEEGDMGLELLLARRHCVGSGVDAVQPEQLVLPTPCASWTVRGPDRPPRRRATGLSRPASGSSRPTASDPAQRFHEAAAVRSAAFGADARSGRRRHAGFGGRHFVAGDLRQPGTWARGSRPASGRGSHRTAAMKASISRRGSGPAGW